jgi:hypothetical protein
MDGPGHYRRAEQLAAKASEYLGRGDGQDSAAVWAAVAQVHATLALAAAAGIKLSAPGTAGTALVAEQNGAPARGRDVPDLPEP